MHRSLLLPPCFLLAVAAATAQERPNPWSAWQQFVREHTGADWHVDWSPAAGTPLAIYGPGARIAAAVPSRDVARDLVRRHVERHHDLLGLGASTVHERTLVKVARVWIAVFEQRFGDLRVLDGRVDVRLHENGTVALFGSVAFPMPRDFVTTPTIASAVARAAAVVATGTPPRTDPLGELLPPRLLIWADGHAEAPCTPRLAWEVALRDAHGDGHAYVDAATGALLQYRHHDHHLRAAATGGTAAPAAARPGASRTAAAAGRALVNVTGQVVGEVSTTRGPGLVWQTVPLPGVRVTIQGGGSALTDSAGNFSIVHAGTSAVTVTADLQNAEHTSGIATAVGSPVGSTVSVVPGTPATLALTTPASPLAAKVQTSAYWLLHRTAEYVRQPHILGGASQLAGLDTLPVTVNDSATPCNAAFTGSALVFAGASSQCSEGMAFSTVVEHEWGHALDNAFGGINSNDGLEEGYADVVANFFTGQPIIGENFFGAGQHVRDATNTHQYPNGSGPHEQGLSWMGGCWLVRQALIASLGAPLGTQHAETIVLGALATNPPSQVQAVREVYVLDDDDGNLNNATPNCSALYASYTTAHAIPSPVTSCSTNPGRFTAYGAGCAGSGLLAQYCQQANGQAGTLAPGAPAGFLVAYAVQPASALQVTAIELYTAAAGSPTGQFTVRADVGGQPAATALRTLTLPLAATAAWCRVAVSPPLALAAGQTYWLVHDGGAFTTALVQGGVAPTRATLVNAFGSGWSGLPPGIPDAPAWRLECSGGAQPGAVPVFAALGVPTIGQTTTFTLDAARPSTIAGFFLGTSDSQYGALTLPFGLAGLGAPNCTLLAAADALAGVVVSAQGTASLPFPIANLPALVDVVVFGQVVVLDPPANALGVVLSNAARLEVGTP